MAEIRVNKDKTAKELKDALEAAVLDENLLEAAAAGAELSLAIADSSGLKAGKSYKLFLDIIPVGNASDAKLTTVAVAIKIAK